MTPPNYAPGLSGVVTMDDVVRETFRRQGWIAAPASTSFTRDVWPIFDRLTGMQWVNHGLFMVHGHGSPLDARDAATHRAAARRLAEQSGLAPARVRDLPRSRRRRRTCTSRVMPQIYGDAFGEGPEAPKDALDAARGDGDAICPFAALARRQLHRRLAGRAAGAAGIRDAGARGAGRASRARGAHRLSRRAVPSRHRAHLGDAAPARLEARLSAQRACRPIGRHGRISARTLDARGLHRPERPV